tara:strand:+ start:346 stop:1500 length:1155 start_codon:yes stop_codon:yes gene_type:complete
MAYMIFFRILKSNRFKKRFISPNNLKSAVLYKIQRLSGYLFDLFFSFIENSMGLLISLDWRTTHKTSENILVCRNKKYSSRSDEDSHEKYQIDDTLTRYGCKVINFYWDQTGIFFGSQIRLWLFITTTKPNTIIFSSYSPGSRAKYSQPPRFFIERIKKKKNTKIIFLWWDSCSDNFYDRNILSLKNIDATHILMENPLIDLDKKPDLDMRILGLYSIFVENDILLPRKKDIDVSFLGQIFSYRNLRREYIEFLMESNVSAYISVFERDNQVSNDKYFEILGRSKIAINFSYSVDKHQFKGRPIEIFHSGAMLLETYNKQTASLFRDGIDYVSFRDKFEMVEKIKYYLFHPDEAEKIAKSGRDRMLSLYNLNIFWDKVFDNEPS